MNIVRMVFFILIVMSGAYGKEPYVEQNILNRLEEKYNAFVTERFLDLQQTLDSVKKRSDLEKLDAVNKYYNEVKYATDECVYKMIDYWATPLEFLGKDRGDCEDYVISKYFALIYLGMESEKLFFTYAKSIEFKDAHMVLTYFQTPRSEPLILDNNNNKVLPASQRKDLIPIYNFNGELLYKASSKGNEEQLNSVKSHTKWDELKANM
ncbi:MAG: hypothetical protein AUK54_08720 [Helicobacteraceae bacterium CG2_30_36_10]|nr:MAG: hypothetical protein AUK54_08720 [Helicobacteraceae bacterium CG2_30_36_10]